jgi:chorismate mutase
VRQQIVEEIAEAKTPHASQEILDAERNLAVRMQQPAFFNYPTPTSPPNTHQVC